MFLEWSKWDIMLALHILNKRSVDEEVLGYLYNQ